jgi:DNA-binding FrmR family transcriptional regulator
MPHQNHPAIIKRLKRADGHLQKIIEMLEDDRPCLLIAQQLQAVESAIESAKKALIYDHISNCLEGPMKTAGSAGRALKEFKLIAKYL